MDRRGIGVKPKLDLTLIWKSPRALPPAMLSGPGIWPKLSEPVKEMALANIHSALGDNDRAMSTYTAARRVRRGYGRGVP
jgi:hypothetical protein